MCITSWCLTHPRKTTFFAVCGVIQCGVGSSNQPKIPEAAASPLRPKADVHDLSAYQSSGDRSWPKCCENCFLLQSGIELICISSYNYLQMQSRFRCSLRGLRCNVCVAVARIRRPMSIAKDAGLPSELSAAPVATLTGRRLAFAGDAALP